MLWLIACLAFSLPAAASPDGDSPPAARTSHEFLPSKHGFHFRNSFTGSPLPKAVRGLGLENLVSVPTRYGKCGGMSAAAADFFLARTPIPPDTKPPVEGTPLFGYITTRQIDSLGRLGSMTGKFMEMMAAPDTSPEATSAASLTAPHIEPLLKRLEQGELIALGLVYVASPAAAKKTEHPSEHPSEQPTDQSTSQATGQTTTKAPPGSPAGPKAAPAPPVRSGALWDNHQVLAFASPGQVERWASQEACAQIRIYDPNFPDNDHVVIFVRKMAQAGNQLPQVFCEQRVGPSRTIRLRGFFPMPYTSRLPPESITSPLVPARERVPASAPGARR